MKRREFITALGVAAVLPLSAYAQARIPVIGFVDPRVPEGMGDRLRAFRQGLREGGYIEGESLAIEYRWAGNQMDRLPALCADLVAREAAPAVGRRHGDGEPVGVGVVGDHQVGRDAVGGGEVEVERARLLGVGERNRREVGVGGRT